MPVSAMSLSDAGARVCLPSSEDIQGVAKFRCGTVFKKDWPFEEFLIFFNFEQFFFALLICFVLFVFLIFFCFCQMNVMISFVNFLIIYPPSPPLMLRACKLTN